MPRFISGPCCFAHLAGTEDRDNYYYGADDLFQQPGLDEWLMG